MDVHQLFSSLKKEAECPLCLDTVKEPKTLPCLHSFCLECLDKHAGYARRQGKTMIKCPVCLADFNIPKSDTFSDLPTSFHLNRLVDILALKDDSVQIQTCNSCDDNSAVTSYCFVCQSFLCATCLEAHQRLKATRGHRNVLIEKLQAQDVEELIHRPVMCTQKYHENETLEYFCKDCNTCVCMKCGFVSHSRHTMLDIQQAAEERKVQITKAVDKAKAEIGVVQTKIERQKEFMKKSTDEMLASQSKVTAIVEALIRILREHETAVKKRLIEINEAQQRDHATRTEEFQLTVSQLNGFVERGSAILNRNIPSEIIRTELTVTSRLEELSKAARVMILQPLHFSYVANEKLEKYRTIMENSGPGKVIASLTDPALSLAGCEPKVLDTMKPCSEVVFKLTTRDSDGNQIYNKEDNVTVSIHPPSEVEEEKIIKNFKDGNYSISVFPKFVGDHDIWIEVNGIPLTRKVTIAHEYNVTQQTFDLRGRENFNFPCSIAQSERTGNIAVANYGSEKVLLFDAGFKYLRTVVNLSQKQKPRCVAFSKGCELIVVTEDSSKQGEILSKVSVYTEDGKFVKHISEDLVNPCSVSVRSDGKIIVCDSGDLCIKLLSADGAMLLKSFRLENFDAFPWFAVYHRKKYFVSYRMGPCVKVFNEQGEYLRDFGQFHSPAGLAIDKFNNLVVCNAVQSDEVRSSVKVLTMSGKVVQDLGFQSMSSMPCSVAVTQNGDVLVSDVEKHAIYIFRYLGLKAWSKRVLNS